jgi:hypothetical protein
MSSEALEHEVIKDEVGVRHRKIISRVEVLNSWDDWGKVEAGDTNGSELLNERIGGQSSKLHLDM